MDVQDQATTTTRFRRARAAIDAVVAATFIAALAAPHLDHLVRDDLARGPTREKRTAAARPAPARTLAELRSWPKRWQAYWNDTFGLRDVLLRGHAMMKVFAFHTAPGKDHVIGDDGWIFWRGLRTVDAWRGVIPLSEDDLEAWRRRIEGRRDACRAAGAEYLFVLCPEKPSIYGEKLPDRLAPAGPSRLDQLAAHLAARSDVAFLDLRPSLLAAKADDRPGNAAYYELGTHWRARGAAVACAAIVERLRLRFPAMAPIPLSEYFAVEVPGNGDTEALVMYLDDRFPQQEHWIEPPLHQVAPQVFDFPRKRLTRRTDRPDLPRGILWHDSFAMYLEKPIAEAFSRLVMVWDYAFDRALVEREKPDVVIEMFAERVLVSIDPRKEAVDELRAAFERATDVRFALDPSSTSGLTPMYRAALHSEADAGGSHVEFVGLGAPDSFVLPPVDLRGKRLLLRADVTSPADSALEVFYRRDGDSGYTPENRVEIRLNIGRSERFLELPEGPLVDRLIVSPGRVPGRYRIHALEIRAAD